MEATITYCPERSAQFNRANAMKKYLLWGTAALGLIGIGACLSSPQYAIWAIYNARLSLYGKVVDQDERPVAGASVRLTVADKPWDSGTSRQVMTDSDGSFKLTGVRGAGIFAGAEKEGYYSGKDSSRLLQSGELPAKDSPAIFRLHRKGVVENLIHYGPVWSDLPLDATPLEFDFKSRKFLPFGQGQLSAQVKVEGSMQQRFSWWYRLRLPGGGFARRTHEFDFIAPEQGYVETIEGRIDAADVSWRGSFGGDFFVRLPDGTFGRVELFLGSGRDSFSFRIDRAALNPAGSRNLEFDPKVRPPMIRANTSP